MKSVINEIVTSLEETAKYKKIEDLRIGLCYTAVLLNDGNLGLAYTFHSKGEYHSCCNAPDSGSLKWRKAQDIVNFSLSENLLESSIGIATVNALVNKHIDNVIEGDILEVVKPHKEDTVGMVGFFGPLIDPLKKSVKKVHIFEEKNIPDYSDVNPKEKIPEILPHCSFIIVSATTLINKTIDLLLPLAHKAREITIVGASTPLLSSVFSKRGVTMLSGIQAVDNERVLQIVSEGGGMRAFKNSIKKVNVCLPRNLM
jgi:uncharacterized protein (DUF4213/DUF364 family)